MEQPFYVYVHRRASDGRVFYVGKGTGSRAISKNRRSEWWKRVERKHGRTVEIILRFVDEGDAIALERELIAWYGRVNLVNFTDGGDGTSGYQHTVEHKKWIGERLRVVKSRPQWKLANKVRAFTRMKRIGKCTEPISIERCSEAEVLKFAAWVPQEPPSQPTNVKPLSPRARCVIDGHGNAYASQTIAASALGLSIAQVSRELNGVRANVHGLCYLYGYPSTKMLAKRQKVRDTHGRVFESAADAARAYGLARQTVSTQCRRRTGPNGFRYLSPTGLQGLDHVTDSRPANRDTVSSDLLRICCTPRQGTWIVNSLHTGT